VLFPNPAKMASQKRKCASREFIGSLLCDGGNESSIFIMKLMKLALSWTVKIMCLLVISRVKRVVDVRWCLVF
jgi:hypothetical protein